MWSYKRIRLAVTKALIVSSLKRSTVFKYLKGNKYIIRFLTTSIYITLLLLSNVKFYKIVNLKQLIMKHRCSAQN